MNIKIQCEEAQVTPKINNQCELVNEVYLTNVDIYEMMTNLKPADIDKILDNISDAKIKEYLVNYFRLQSIFEKYLKSITVRVENFKFKNVFRKKSLILGDY